VGFCDGRYQVLAQPATCVPYSRMGEVNYVTNQGPVNVSSGPVYKWAEAVIDNDTDLPDGLCRCLYIGVSGDLVIHDAEGNTITFANCPVGILPAMCLRITEATTAGSILAGY
jgi:hypothetical protein